MNTNKIFFFSFFILLLTACNGGTGKTGMTLDTGVEKKIDSILSQMTLEEKVGQMAQFTIDLIGILVA